MTATRRLAAILAADVAGYSRLIGAQTCTIAGMLYGRLVCLGGDRCAIGLAS